MLITHGHRIRWQPPREILVRCRTVRYRNRSQRKKWHRAIRWGTDRRRRRPGREWPRERRTRNAFWKEVLVFVFEVTALNTKEKVMPKPHSISRIYTSRRPRDWLLPQVTRGNSDNRRLDKCLKFSFKGESVIGNWLVVGLFVIMISSGISWQKWTSDRMLLDCVGSHRIESFFSNSRVRDSIMSKLRCSNINNELVIITT